MFVSTRFLWELSWPSWGAGRRMDGGGVGGGLSKPQCENTIMKLEVTLGQMLKRKSAHSVVALGLSVLVYGKPALGRGKP